MKHPTELANRRADPKGSEKVLADLRTVKATPRESEPADLGPRLEAARAIVPVLGEQLHCGHCWGEGRDAAIRAIENWKAAE